MSAPTHEQATAPWLTIAPNTRLKRMLALAHAPDDASTLAPDLATTLTPATVTASLPAYVANTAPTLAPTPNHNDHDHHLDHDKNQKHHHRDTMTRTLSHQQYFFLFLFIILCYIFSPFRFTLTGGMAMAFVSFRSLSPPSVCLSLPLMFSCLPLLWLCRWKQTPHVCHGRATPGAAGD